MSTPREVADTARNEALEAIADAHKEGDGPAEIAPAEQNALDAFADAMADALIDGLRDSQTSPYASAVADATKFYNKTDVKGRIQEAVEEKESDGKITLDELVENELREVKVVYTTDHKQGALYRWNFEECEIETRSGKDGRGHYHWKNFRDSYFEAGGTRPDRPNKAYRGGEEWSDFIADIIEERKVVEEVVGPRTDAVEELKSYIYNSTGYTDDKEMFNRDGIGLEIPTEDVPEWWDLFESPPTTVETPATVTEIHVPGYEIDRIVDRHGISKRALQTELDARGYTLPHVSGVSQYAYFNGSRKAYWALSPDLRLPRAYDPDPQSAAERVAHEQQDEADAAPLGWGTTDDEDDEDGARDSETGFVSVGGGSQ